MPGKQNALLPLHPDSLEQTIAVGQPTITSRQPAFIRPEQIEHELV
ncbi:hypothetical protein [Parasphingorhabdus sp.]